jgi:hypothetical protein
MANDNLENLVKTGSLKAEPPAHDEIAGLIASGLARLDDSRNEDLSLESRFDLAYNAAHALSLGVCAVGRSRDKLCSPVSEI